MKFKYVAIATITSAIMLSACDININTGGDDSNKSSSESKNNDSQKNNDQQSNDNQSNSRKVINKMLQHKITTILM